MLIILFPVLVDRTYAQEVDEAIEWLAGQAHRLIRTGSTSIVGGVTAFPPEANNVYPGFWLRDYSYMLEGSRNSFSNAELVTAYQFFISKQRADGACVDTVRFDGTPCYQPGFGTMGDNPVADGSQFMVNVAWQTFDATGDTNLLASTIGNLEDAMQAVPRNAQTGLVYITPGETWERCPYGFTDSVRKQGDLLFCSLLYVQAGRRMADLYDALGQTTNAQRWTQETQQLEQTIRDQMWDSEWGLFRAATVQADQPDIWGSAFAAYLGVASEEQSLTIANYFKDNYSGIVLQGQIRHLPAGMYWEGTTYQDRYQNGGFWATPTGWFVHTLDRVDSALADQTIVDMVNNMKTHGINEYILITGPAVPEYNASAAAPLAALLEIRDVTYNFGVDGTFVPITDNASSAVDPWCEATANSGTDGVWFHVEGDDTYLAYLSEDAAMITTSVSGLDADLAYEISIITMAGNSDWAVQACQAGGTLSKYDASSPGAFNTYRLYNEPPNVDYYQIPVFRISGATEFSIDIDDLDTANTRVWGIAYTVIEALSGDANLDGKVDNADAAILAGNWLATDATWGMGDFNRDGIINDLDATLLAANWQTGVDEAAANVPEPSGVILLMCTAVAGLLFFRKRDLEA